MTLQLENLYVYKEAQGPYWCVAWYTNNYELTAEDQRQLFMWCYENFGPGLGDMRCEPVQTSPFTHRWVNDIEWGELRFSREADLNWFLMRWA
jgi:hypothetical protein